MKFSFAVPIVSALVAAAAASKVVLAPFTNEVKVGETYLVEWLQDGPDTLELWVVTKGDPETNIAWEDYENLFSNKKTKPIDGSYSWTVGDLEPGKKYGLWISGKSYADLTKWFDVVPAEEGIKEEM